jgi:hypothetical protein
MMDNPGSEECKDIQIMWNQKTGRKQDKYESQIKRMTA